MVRIQRGGSQTREMLGAAESGAAARQRAEQSLQGQYAQNQQQGAQLGGMAMQGVQAGTQLDQNQQQIDEQARANKAREGLTERGQDIQMAAQGLQEDPRARKLREDMQRGAEQGQKPLEFDGPRVIPTQESLDEKASKQALNEYKAQTERERVRAYQQQVTASANKAQAAGNEEQFKAAMEKLALPIKSDIATLNDAMSNSPVKSQAAIAKLRERFGDVQDPQVKQALDQGIMNPALRRFMQNQIMTSAVQVMADTGELPITDASEIDFSSPMMQALQQNASAAVQIANALGVQVESWKDRNRLINRVAAAGALAMFSGRTNMGPQIGPAVGAMPQQQGQPGDYLNQQGKVVGTGGPGSESERPLMLPNQQGTPRAPAGTMQQGAQTTNKMQGGFQG